MTTVSDPFDDLRPTGEHCPDCGEEIMESVISLFGQENKFRLVCKCISAKRDAERNAMLDAGRAIARNGMRKAAGLYRRWAEIRLPDITPKPGQEYAYRNAKKFAERFYDRDDGKGIVFTGATGCGKTMLAAGIANAVIDITGVDGDEAERVAKSRMVQRPDRTPVRFANIVDLLSQIKAGYDAGGAQKLVDAYQGSKLAIIDDVGAEKLNEWSVERLFEIVNWRYGECLPIIITTNCNASELEQRVGARIKDRLYEMCYIIPIEAGSQRRAI